MFVFDMNFFPWQTTYQHVQQQHLVQQQQQQQQPQQQQAQQQHVQPPSSVPSQPLPPPTPTSGGLPGQAGVPLASPPPNGLPMSAQNPPSYQGEDWKMREGKHATNWVLYLPFEQM